MPYDASAKAEARAHVAAIRATTGCAICGAQPVEWHHEDHVERENRRIAHLVALGFPIPVIDAEIARCTPYCRRHHMAIDGRLGRLIENRPFHKGDKQPPKPCAKCGILANPLWRGKCRRCYDWDRRHPTPASSRSTPPCAGRCR